MILGAILSLASALSFSVNNVLARRGMTGGTASQGAFISVLLGVPLFILAALVTGQIFNFGDIPINGYWLLAIAGVLHFVAGRYCNYRAIGAIGSARSQPIQTLNIPYSVLIAFVFLGETINWPMAFGILLIMVGPAIIIENSQRGTPAAAPRGAAQGADTKYSPPFQLRQLEGYTFAILASVCYGTSPLLIRAALQDQTDISILGGLIAYVAASAFLVFTLVFPANRNLIRAVSLRSFKLFAGSGFFVFLAQLLRFVALSLAPVAIVTPLQRLAALFTLVLAATVNRDLEKINKRVVIAVLISLAGSIILVLGRYL